MFVCANCNRRTRNGEKGELVTTHKRLKQYEHEIKKPRSRYTKKIRSKGWEIAKEERWCSECIKKKDQGKIKVEVQVVE